ncbi:MAG: membrane protein insertase YidC [Gammaproteobacteria bacterium]|nr:membrane protein insertase YidC [Gammaproteobacteria bacterium]
MNLNYVRLALYGLLFLLAFILFNLWQKEHPSQVLASARTSILAPEETPAGMKVENATLPSSSPVMGMTTPTLVSNDLVQIKTDVIDATIDLKGGNLIKVQLPAYPESLQAPHRPYQLLSFEPDSLYIAQSGIRSVIPPHVPVSYRTTQSHFELMPGQNALKVVLQGRNAQGIDFTKTYTFARQRYVISVEVVANNVSSQAWDGQAYEQLLRKKAETKTGITSAFLFNPFIGAAYSTQDHPYQKINFKKMASSNLDLTTNQGWVAMLEHYFLSAWIPTAGEKVQLYTQTEDNLYSIGMLSTPQHIMPGQKMTQQATLYAGPLITHDLKSIAPHLDLTVDYGWLWIISEALFWLLNKIHSVIGNWGWSIVMVTILVKALFYRLSASSYRSMAAMRAIQPKIQALRERYGDDKQKLSQAMMEIYRKEKVNPLGGCLPMLVQIPVFLALYWVLFASVELRQAPFILWIRDLSTPDPYYVLPILMGLSMLIQQKLSPPPPDPTQAKVMMLMPLVLTLFFLNFPAGLVLYWVVNNTLSILQQVYITRRLSKHTVKTPRG